MASGVSAFVRLGVTSYGPFRWIPRFIEHYATKRPDVEITLVTVQRDEVYSSLMQGKVDVSIIDDGMVPSGVVRRSAKRQSRRFAVVGGSPKILVNASRNPLSEPNPLPLRASSTRSPRRTSRRANPIRRARWYAWNVIP